METISASEARNNLAAIIEKSQHEPVTIQKQGRNAAVLVSFEEFERLTNSSVTAFHSVCDEIGEKAESKGLTEEELARILAEDDN